MNLGVVLPEPGYLEAVREITNKYGIVLIFDEVKTGLTIAAGGATGNLWDRISRAENGPLTGHVVDFIYTPWMMPAIYNVADMFITAAAVMVIWLSMITQVTPAGVRTKESADAGHE